MVANPNTLYLQEIPNLYSSKVVQLTPYKDSEGNISPQALALLLAAMTQTLLTDMSKMVEDFAQQAEANAEAAQNSVGMAKVEQQQTQQATANYQAQLDAQNNPPWWKSLLDVITKYVLPAVMTLVAGLIFGPAAFVVAAVVLALTAIPVPGQNGKSLVGVVSSDIAEGLGQDFGWSAGTTQLVEGILNVVIAAALAVVGGNAASAGTATEAVVETATSEVSSAVTTIVEESAESALADASSTVSKFKANAGKFTTFSTFATVTASTNSWYNIAYGVWQIADKNPADKDKGKLVAEIIGMVMNLIVAIGSMVGSFSAFSQGLEESSNLSPLAKFLGGEGSLALLKILGGAQWTVNGASGVATIGQGFAGKNMADLEADITKLKAQLNFIEAVDHIASDNSKDVGAELKSKLSDFDTLLGRNVNYSSVDFTIAKELQVNNNRA